MFCWPSSCKVPTDSPVSADIPQLPPIPFVFRRCLRFSANGPDAPKTVGSTSLGQSVRVLDFEHIYIGPFTPNADAKTVKKEARHVDVGLCGLITVDDIRIFLLVVQLLILIGLLSGLPTSSRRGKGIYSRECWTRPQHRVHAAASHHRRQSGRCRTISGA